MQKVVQYRLSAFSDIFFLLTKNYASVSSELALKGVTLPCKPIRTTFFAMYINIDQMHHLVVNIGKAYCNADWNYRDVNSPFTRIYYVCHGRARIETLGNVTELMPGRLYIIPAFTRHSCYCDGEFTHYYIHIYNDGDYDILEDLDLPVECEGRSDTEESIKRIMELAPGMELAHYEPTSYDNQQTLSTNIRKNKMRNLSARIESRGLIYMLLSAFIQRAQYKHYVKDDRIVRAIDYIRTHLSEKIDLQQLGDVSCLSKDHLVRLFKKEMNTTPICYVNDKKIERAQIRLITETKSIRQIAYELGFDDQPYFNRLFKKTTGVTPLNYRRTFGIG